MNAQNKDLLKKVVLLGETNFILDVAFQQDANCEYLVTTHLVSQPLKMMRKKDDA